MPRPCPVAAALEVVGERWSLLVVRDLFYDVRRFDRIARATGPRGTSLPAGCATWRRQGSSPGRSTPSTRLGTSPTSPARAETCFLCCLRCGSGGRRTRRSRSPSCCTGVTDRAVSLAHPLHVTTVCLACGERVHADDVTAVQPPG